MAQLSAQSILKRCRGPRPMISPFSEEKVVINGKSYGLSAASYDITIAHDLQLGMHPGYLLADLLRSEDDPMKALCMFKEHLPPPSFALAHSVEDFIIPDNIVGYVCDKSTYARLHVSAFNTVFDPGFEGNATLEVVNLSDRPVVIRAGDPICQLVFHWLDMPTDRPYAGKYQRQPARPVGAILEGMEGNEP